MVGYDNLANFYSTIFALVQHHKWNPEWIEKLMPWEKFIYVDQLKAYIKAEEDKARDIALANKRR